MTSEPDRTTPADRSTDGSDSHGTTVRSTSDDDTSTYAPKHYQDLPFDRNSGWKSGYIDFSSNPPTRSESTLPSSLASASTHSNDIHQMLTQAAMLSTQSDSDGEDDGEKHVATAKKLLFPSSLASSFPEVAQTLRNERRQEFCPIYTDETPEQVALRQAKRKPVGSLLAKRIRWDELKRKREADDYAAQMQFHYNAYGPAQSQQQASFANPYEQYYTAMQHQQEEVCSPVTCQLHFTSMFRWCECMTFNSGTAASGRNTSSNQRFKATINQYRIPCSSIHIHLCTPTSPQDRTTIRTVRCNRPLHRLMSPIHTDACERCRSFFCIHTKETSELHRVTVESGFSRSFESSVSLT